MSTFAAIVLILLAPLPAHPAYLDPGSGSFILQLILASLLGGLFILKGYWRRIAGFFRARFSGQPDESEDPEE